MADPIIEQFRVQNAGLSKLVRDRLASFFGSLNLANPEAVRDALLEFVPLLVAEYGSVAESLALDFYDDLRAASGAAGRFRAISGAAAIPPAAIEAKVRYLAGELWTATPGAILSPLLGAVDKYVKQPGRNAIEFNAKREGVRFARVPQGAKTCSFCLVLASRDAIYLTKRSAGDQGRGLGDRFHGKCDCAVVRVAGKSDFIEGYLPDDYYSKYEVAVDAAANDPEVRAFMDSLPPDDKNKQLKGVAYAMRREFPHLVKDGVHTH